MAKLYIITGGPGSGKTTLIKALEQQGFYCYHEIARLVIKEQLALKTNALPWADIKMFSEIILSRMLVKIEDAKRRSEVCFTDRGIPDIIAYLNNGNVPIEEAYHEVLFDKPYQQKVFIMPPWPEIYANDEERRESPAEAAKIYNALKESYIQCGFQLIELPKISLELRVKLVLQHIND